MFLREPCSQAILYTGLARTHINSFHFFLPAACLEPPPQKGRTQGKQRLSPCSSQPAFSRLHQKSAKLACQRCLPFEADRGHTSFLVYGTLDVYIALWGSPPYGSRHWALFATSDQIQGLLLDTVDGPDQNSTAQVFREKQVRNIYLSYGFDRVHYLASVDDAQLSQLRALAASTPAPDTAVMTQTLFHRFEPDDCQNWIFTVVVQAELSGIFPPGVSSLFGQLPRY